MNSGHERSVRRVNRNIVRNGYDRLSAADGIEGYSSVLSGIDGGWHQTAKIVQLTKAARSPDGSTRLPYVGK